MRYKSIILRYVSFMLSLCLLCTMTLSVSAISVSPDFIPIGDTESEEIILDYHYFRASNGTLETIEPEVMRPYAEVYTPGDIYIEDILGSTSGKITADRKQLIGQAALNATITIISNVPGVGDVVSNVSGVINTLKPLYSALFYIDYTKSYEVKTWYSYRNFTHRILRYSNAGTWQEIGSSL